MLQMVPLMWYLLLKRRFLIWFLKVRFGFLQISETNKFTRFVHDRMKDGLLLLNRVFFGGLCDCYR